MTSNETPETNGRLTQEEAQGVDRYMHKFFPNTAMVPGADTQDDWLVEPLEED